MMQQEKTASSLGRKLLSALLAIALVISLAPTVSASQAFAESAAPFTAQIGTTAIDSTDIACTTGGYPYKTYGSTTPTPVDLYTITVPQGTTEVTLDLGPTARLAYYYDGDNNYLGSVVDASENYYLVGDTEYTVKLDCDANGANDYVFIQNVYNADYSGGELLYVVTFVEEGATPAATPAAVDKSVTTAATNAQYATIYANINKGLSNVGGYGSKGEQQYLEVAAAAAGNTAAISKTAVLAMAQDAYENTPARLPFAIIECSVLGIDATQVQLADGTEINLVAALAESDAITSGYITSSAFALLAYASGPYEVDASAQNSPRALINKLVDEQDEQGGWGTTYGVDTTAMVIPALAAYANDESAAAALAKAVTYLKVAVSTDGGYGNANSTAVAIVALCAVGEDPAAAVKSLVGQASSTLDAFLYEGEANDLATAQGFLALAAYQGMVNTGKAYNVYTQAKSGQAKLPETKASDSTSQASTSSTSISTAASTTTAKTSDCLPDITVATILVLCASGAALIALRFNRKRKSE